MGINNILTTRNLTNWPSAHIVYEWEDQIADMLHLELKNVRKPFMEKLRWKVYRRFPALKSRKKFTYDKSARGGVVFIFSGGSAWQYPLKNMLPIFLDTPMGECGYIEQITRPLPVYFVTALDTYYGIKAKNPSARVAYLPLSVPDQYIKKQIPKKEIDVIQFGRKNAVLHNYMLEYCRKHPSVEYVYQTKDASLTYVSTKRGKIGRFAGRANYMKLMGKCKVSLVSSPCVDGGRKADFGDMDFITPRFYESAANWCYMVGRYTQNEEANRLNLASVCPNVRTKDEFIQVLEQALSASQFLFPDAYEAFLKLHATSKRVWQMQEILRGAGV